MTDALVIGAGMAGLTAAAELQRAGCGALVLDKGRGVGGWPAGVLHQERQKDDLSLEG